MDVEIADFVHVTKRHQQLDEIRIIFTCTSSRKSERLFSKNFVIEYTPSTLNAIHFAKYTLVISASITDRKQLC